MNQSIRVAVLELGSRAVRLLVADVSPEIGVQVVGTSYKEISVLETFKPPGPQPERLEELKGALTSLRGRAAELGTVRFAAFGTEAVRKLKSKALKELQAVIPELRVLTVEEEAELSLFAGLIGLRHHAVSKLGNVLVVDQGSGSMEVALGKMVGPTGLTLTEFHSYRLGTSALVALLRQDNGNLERLQKSLVKRLSSRHLVGTEADARPIIFGSAVTKLAWIKVRKSPFDRYDPRQVHGQVLSLATVDSFIDAAMKDADSVRRIIDPRNPDSGEFETVITGLLALGVFLHKIGKGEFVVSGHGTRYGFAWKLALQPMT